MDSPRYDATHGKKNRILIRKHMTQRQPIALPQVEAVNTNMEWVKLPAGSYSV